MSTVNILHAKVKSPKARMKQIQMLLRSIREEVKATDDEQAKDELFGYMDVLNAELGYLREDYPWLEKYYFKLTNPGSQFRIQ